EVVERDHGGTWRRFEHRSRGVPRAAVHVAGGERDGALRRARRLLAQEEIERLLAGCGAVVRALSVALAHVHDTSLSEIIRLGEYVFERIGHRCRVAEHVRVEDTGQ